jgi:3-deoxy-D-manno-octulosonate 8-phosphate phosphatase (KDO 8-P phosphatase)
MSDLLNDKAKAVKLLILDVDGVLTDGRIVYGNYGDELKFFNVHDGLGMTLLKRAGISSVIITARKSKIVKRRARDFGASSVYSDHDKLKIYKKVLSKFNVREEEVCFIGDDLLDLPVLKRSGLAVAVPTAVDEVKNAAHYVTSHRGGFGAVREICDIILKATGKWEAVAAPYLT